jgi:RNA polymerase sigma-70 factor (ECF subfamily)
MTDIAWMHTLLSGARPQAVAALLRYFRDLDAAEEAFQDACLRALKTCRPPSRSRLPCASSPAGR